MMRLAALPETLPQFHIAGRVAVWSLRHWVYARRDKTRVRACVWHTVDRVWQSNSIRHELMQLWSNMHRSARKSILIRSPLDEQLSTDERMIVGALCAARARLPELVRWLLADLLGVDAMDETCRAFEQLGIRMRRLSCSDDGVAIRISDTESSIRRILDATNVLTISSMKVRLILISTR